MADSIQSETNFSVSKLLNDGPSVLMHIIWSRVFSPNFVCSTDFFCLCKKNHSHKCTEN